ncbi:MAG: hypothetical protein JW966_11110 [Anaerolineae bacterium]|nr:hypothetical protein [Anaerolineae bacterium]
MNGHRRWQTIVGMAAVVALLMACNWTWLAGPAPDQGTVKLTVLPAVSPSPDDTLDYSACSWQWAQEVLPDETTQLADSLSAANLPVNDLTVFAYGEDCFNAEGNVVRFAAMETDFLLTLAVDDLDDSETLGDLAADALVIIVRDFPVSDTPGPMPGQITLSFEARDGSTAVTPPIKQNIAADWVAQDLRGSALIRALGL